VGAGFPLTTCVGEVGLLACFGICWMARAGDGQPPVASANRNGMELRDEDVSNISVSTAFILACCFLLCVSCFFVIFSFVLGPVVRVSWCKAL